MKMSKDRIDRIKAMESTMNRVAAALNSDAPLSDSAREDLKTLNEYYQNQWLSDFEADEKGLLPDSLKRGVLSEDALYDLLSEADERLLPENKKSPVSRFQERGSDNSTSALLKTRHRG